jgi:hypothetical protein
LSQTPGEDLFNLFRRLLGESCLQVFAADAVFAQKAADEPCGAAEEIGGFVGIEQARGAQQRDREAADRGIADRLEAVAQARLDAEEQAVHREAAAKRLDRFARQDQRRVLPAETERVGHHRRDLGVARLVADHIERESRGPGCRN